MSFDMAGEKKESGFSFTPAAKKESIASNDFDRRKSVNNRTLSHTGMGLMMAPGESLGGLSLQARLKVGSAHDPLEKEADQVADRVMSMPDPSAGASVQRAASPEEEDKMQMKAAEEDELQTRPEEEDKETM